MYIPGETPYAERTPYVVYAVNVDDDPEEEVYVIGNRIIPRLVDGQPENAAPTGEWIECRLDPRTPVHVTGWRENLPSKYTTWNYGLFSDLIESPLVGERTWGDLDIVFIEICAGVSSGPPFIAYIDDIIVGHPTPPTPATFESQVDELCRQLIPVGTQGSREILAITPFVFNDLVEEEAANRVNMLILKQISEKNEVGILDQLRVEEALESLDISAVKLADTENAIDFGRRLGADLVLTGRVFRIGQSLTIFGRVVNTRTGTVKISGQVSIPLVEDTP